VSRREQIKMTAAEAEAFLADERTLVCATIGPRGWPHLMPLWYVLREAAPLPAGGMPAGEAAGAASGERLGRELWAWTYGASQKVRNLERDGRATLQVEAGELYQELRGVMLECDVRVHRDLETVQALGHEIFRRYASPRGEAPASELPAEVGAVVDQQARKRVALQFVELRRATWDHRKLAGVY
jgi:pyridoxamine 5'-phosphate oxidase-like protein